MPITQPYPELDELLASMDAGGQRISEIGASEAGAGNFSVLIGWDVEVRRRFPLNTWTCGRLPRRGPHPGGDRSTSPQPSSDNRSMEG
ncbi:hypothetical protein [Georgenia sp. AZ-5]|uniref:hypothetical protein n=1 Tax=Georgenia sp. AZ-5 TaxID=3367526 RepID=UPI00375539B1